MKNSRKTTEKQFTMKNKPLFLTLFSAIALLLSPINYVTARNIQSESITDTAKLKNTNIEQKRADTLNGKAATFRNGGVEKFGEWLTRSMIYPENTYRDNIGGRIKVQIVIGPDGKVKEIILPTDIHPDLKKEISNAIKRSPKWSPATQNGRPVSMRLFFAVNFNINND